MGKNKAIDFIEIKGARTHNLKNINVKIPLGKMTCIAGPSGSGKSSIAFHTLLTESKRRLINSFPTEYKFFWDIPNTVDVDSIKPVLPVWGLSQTNPIIGSRPAVLDILGVNSDIQKIFYHIGKNTCPIHKVPFEKTDKKSELELFIKKEKIKDDDVVHLFLNSSEYVSHFQDESMKPSRTWNDESLICSFNEDDPYWEVLRLKVKNLQQLGKKLEEAHLKDKELFCFFKIKEKGFLFSDQQKSFCPICHEEEDVEILSSQQLSPFNGLGACSECKGHGMNLIYDRRKLVKNPQFSIDEGAVSFIGYKRFQYLLPSLKKAFKKNKLSLKEPFESLPEKKWDILYDGDAEYPGFYPLFEYLESKRYKKNVRILIRSLQSEFVCKSCDGSRIADSVQNIRIFDKNKELICYQDFLKMNLSECSKALKLIQKSFKESKETSFLQIKNLLSKSIKSIDTASELGLSYLKASDKVKNLKASEYQRVLLVKFLSFEGSGSLFVFDEPSLTLDPNEQKKLIQYMKVLVKQGNTVLYVDHSEQMQKSCDHLILMGPGAGERGGKITYEGKFQRPKPIDLSWKTKLENKRTRYIKADKLSSGIFRDKSFKVPLDQLTWIQGGSKSGASQIIFDALANQLYKNCYGQFASLQNFEYKKIESAKNFEEVLIFSPTVGKNSGRSTVGTAIGLSPVIRKHFSKLDISKSLDLKDGHFSSNSNLGQCPSCEGKGVKTIEMNFLEDVVFSCDDCQGMKLRPFYATISDGNFTVFEALNNPMSEIIPTIKLTPKFKRVWELLKLLKLDYLSLDRSLSSLSGGERQRLKLLSSLDKEISQSILFFENISIGLSSVEISKIGEFLHKLLALGNTIVVLDQNPIFSKIAHNSINFNEL